MIPPAAAELIRRAREQVTAGMAHARRGDIVLACVWLNAGCATLDALHALLDEPAQKPLRRMALVVMPRDEEAEPEWFSRKANDNGGDGAA